jgi:hypothetical protein
MRTNMPKQPGIPTRPPDNVPLRTPRTVYRVAPYFDEGYGGTSTHATEAEALLTRDGLISRGFGVVRVWKVTIEWIAR